MDDSGVMAHINQLVDEEHALLRKGESTGLGDGEKQRLHAVQVSLDQYWDLLRQRRARREFGQDPDEARVRPERIVEHFRQ